ncbi:MupA/Atu3671 family FMN-dependent luciferase-like monooxygenase [Salinispora fenicalii]|uniref:MupA/Atu3671 family FMN-dependent luciferase-like monooxygenase n=1 Tax=Salinispora fenicalii TaxID=1137263 RepID=UPI00048646CB|nr:MupA/Atu3671 family FMN-dependent luciferase-like monooxygenase [Salinispora fenicalii]
MEFSVYFFAANDRYDFGDRYRFILEVAQFIDARGFTAIWTPERHFQEFGGSFPNPAVLSAAIATTTTSIGLRAGSVVVPHHHPVRIIEEWALVDQLSGGRAGLCLATGWHHGDFVFYPQHYETRREYTFDAIGTLQALWRGDAVGFPGPDGAVLPVRTFPRPCQAELPLWLVHTSNPQTWIEAGTRGLNVLTLLDSWERLEQNIAAYRAARERAGHDPGGGIVTVGLHTYVGADDDSVWQLVREPVKKYLGSFMSQKSSDSRAGASAGEAERDRLAEIMAEDYFQRRSLLGSEEKCLDVVRRLSAIGVSEVACLVDFGLPFDTIMRALPRLDAVRQRAQQPHQEPEAGAVAPSSAELTWYYARSR